MLLSKKMMSCLKKRFIRKNELEISKNMKIVKATITVMRVGMEHLNKERKETLLEPATSLEKIKKKKKKEGL